MFDCPNPALDRFRSEFDSIRVPILNYRTAANYCLSPFQLFALAFTLFMAACPLMGWCDLESPTVGTLECFGGIALYIIGFFDWYSGRTLLALIDFLWGLFFFLWYHCKFLGRYNIPVPLEDGEITTNLRGVTILIFAFINVFLLAGVRNRGIFYSLSLFLAIVGLIFHGIHEITDKIWSRKTGGYFYFFSSILFWITGLGRGITDIFMTSKFPGVDPNL